MNEREIFAAALEKRSAAERAAFLDSVCGADAAVRERVEALLAEQANLGSFLEWPPAGVVASAAATIDQPLSEGPGTQIGPYKLLQQIGEGGMGVVYMAEQKEPVERRVALKIIKPGMDTRQVIARFEAERQALAMMDHPNIAKVLDAGATESGRPYFVMELVKGQPITQYCDEHHLTPRQRLELLLTVCQAIQHAHQKGIIHRDIKPTNILVAEYDQKAVPKVIDFGVAKAISQTLTEKTMFTGFGQLVGTLEYMSPEQAKVNQLDIDTRSDIYSLGVLLYELLTGSTPIDKQRLRSAAWDEMLRIIREEEPEKPSTRLSSSGATRRPPLPLGEGGRRPGEGAALDPSPQPSLASIAALRNTEPARLSKLIRGELDWIVMKALEKDRNRRYETANGLARDLERYLADEPVQACPPSAAYRLRKFVRRNKPLFLTAAIVAAALLLGIVGTTWQAIRATRASAMATAEAEKAKTEAAITRAVNDFINEDLLGQANPQNEPDREIKLYAVVERATDRVECRFRKQPLVEAAIRQTLGDVYNRLGDYVKAEAQHRAALEIHRRELGPRHATTAASMTSLAADLNPQQRHVEAETMQRKALEINLAALGPEHPATLDSKSGLARSNTGQGRYAEAEQLHRQVYEIRVQVLGPEHHETLVSRTLTGGALLRLGHAAEAEAVFREVLATRRRILPADHPAILNTMEFLAKALRAQKRLAEAEQILREVVAVRRRVLLPQHPATVRSLKALANVQQEWGGDADTQSQWVAASIHVQSGLAHRDAGRTEEAAEEFRQAIALVEPLIEKLPLNRDYREQLGRCYLWLSAATPDSQEKDAVLARALPLWQRLAEDFPKAESIWCDLGEVHASRGEWQQAVDAQTKAIEVNQDFWNAWQRRGLAHMKLKQWTEAVADLTRSQELDPNHWQACSMRGISYAELAQWDQALLDYERAIVLGSSSPWPWVGKAGALAQLQQPDKALTTLKEAATKGFLDAKTLQEHGPLAPLRDRADFKQLVAELDAKK